MDVDVAAPSGAESALEEAAGASGATSDAPRAGAGAGAGAVGKPPAAGGKKKDSAPARKSKRQIEKEDQEERERLHKEAWERRRAEQQVALALAAEENKWRPMKNLANDLASTALGGDSAAAMRADADAAAIVAAAPVIQDDAAEKEKERERESAAPDSAPDSSAPPEGAEEEPEPEEDKEEAADVAAFLGSVTSRNSGAADVAWRLLLHVTSRWCPTSEGASTDDVAPDAAAAEKLKAKRSNQWTKNRARDVSGGFCLKNAPRPATLLRLAAAFGVGDGAGAPRVHLCLADAAVRASRAALGAAYAATHHRRRKADGYEGPVLSDAAAKAAAEVTEGLPASHFVDAANAHLDAAVAAADDDDFALMAEYHFVRGNLAAAEGSIALAEEHLRASVDAATLAESGSGSEEGAKKRLLRDASCDGAADRLSAAAARAALADVRLHAVVAGADASLQAGNTAELLAVLAPLLLPLDASGASAGAPQRGGSHAPVVLTPTQREKALRTLAKAAKAEGDAHYPLAAGGETASHTTPFAWCTPFLKDFSRRHSSPALPFQRLTGKTFD
jgi:calcineurin-binding protein cabin-1